MQKQTQKQAASPTPIRKAKASVAFRLSHSVVEAVDNIARNQNLDRADVLRQSIYRDLNATYGITVQGDEVVG